MLQFVKQYRQALGQELQRLQDGGRSRTLGDFGWLDSGALDAFAERYFAIDADERTTTLGFAASEGNNHMVRCLLRWKDKDEQDQFGYTPLMKAAENGHMPVMETLLDQGADATFRHLDDGSTSIIAAALGGYNEIVIALLNKGADKDSPAANGRTPLMEASRKGHLPVVKTLLNADADVTLAAHGLTDEDYCLGDNCTALHFATAGGHLGVVNALLSKGGLEIDAVDTDGTTALHLAVIMGRSLPIMETLLVAGADPDIRINTGGVQDCPLETACHSKDNIGTYHVCKTLIDHGADVNSRCPFGSTPLHHACDYSQSDAVLRLLLQAGADENALNDDGDTPGVRELLADRAWRRRGWLVMLRLRTLKAGGDGGAAGARSAKQRGGSGGGEESFNLSEAVEWLGVVEEGVFRNVVSFL
ncbi:ankyrin repeat protein [Ectocarpus siliculosus]|uniref:Ankyrin repeat protein n=1 Tax=Ectocarpus siliculosus TaxID=2880 RepID=D7FVI9_ECTSI|nr:ankyrin repeat protein [Ectocarpus siliculosus]|eukprot:CBJ31910.1 ankyrin repeat protein [Ectocarpus siliculosus]